MNDVENLLKGWKCPDCGGMRIEEIMSGVEVATIIEAVFEDGDADYGPASNDGGVVLRYQCLFCGRDVCDAKNMEDLAAFLQGSA